MAKNFDPDDNENQLPGLTDEEIASLEQERTTFDETEAQMGNRMLKQALVPAVHTLTQIALHSSNERFRMQASQYIIERNMGRVGDYQMPVDDPIADLLADVVREYEEGNI